MRRLLNFQCNVCSNSHASPIWESPSGLAITSLCQITQDKVHVYFCNKCGHLQTTPMGNLTEFYESEYKILMSSEEEDQLYAMRPDGRKIYRTEHQLDTLLGKVKIPHGARVLDFGCAKAATLRRLLTSRPDLIPFVYDVSEMYRTFWHDFIPVLNQAVHSTPPSWQHSFDIILSFFALEHVAEPEVFVCDVAKLLTKEGVFYCVVPNVYENPADLVVSDHVNHFSESSIRTLFSNAGLDVRDIDDRSHASAWVVTASRGKKQKRQVCSEELNRGKEYCLKTASYWNNFLSRVADFERSTVGKKTAIYGSGFYGAFLASCLKDLNAVECFVDRNPHRHNQSLFGKRIVPPDAVPKDVQAIYAAINPSITRSVEEMLEFKDMTLDYFFT